MANFKVVDGALNVRKGPSLHEKSVNFIREGDVVRQKTASDVVTEVRAPDPDPKVRTWVRLNDDEFDGWISLKNLTLMPDGRLKVEGASGANVREEPLLDPTDANVVTTLPKATIIPAGAMVAEKSDADFRRWVRLDLGTEESGWSSLLLLEETTDPVSRGKSQYRVTASALNVRSAPSLTSNIVGTVNMDQKFDEGTIVVAGERSWMAIDNPAGFVSMKFLSKIDALGSFPGAPPWYAIARGEEGIKEAAGSANNPEVVKFLRSCSTLGANHQRRDSTAWCSAFVNWCVEQAGLEGTESAAARSWHRWGKPIANPVLGCIVVLSRTTNPAFGHVGFFVKETASHVFLLGGNQADSVNVTAFRKSRVLRNGYRTNS